MFKNLVLIIIICSSCKTSNQVIKCSPNDTLLFFLGNVGDEEDKWDFKGIIYYLNMSKEDQSTFIFKREPYNTAYSNSFYYLEPVQGLVDSNFRIYCSYRIADYLGDIDKNTLLNILTDSYNKNLSIMTDCLDELYSIETAYLKCYLTEDNTVRSNSIDSLRKFAIQFPEFHRIKYLLNSVLFDFEKKDDAIHELKNLLKENYYSKPILSKLITYYINSKNLDSLQVYSKVYLSKFSDNCNYADLILNSIKNQYHKYDSLIFCPYRFYNQRDSIKYTVLYTRSLLDFFPEEALNYYNKYEASNSGFIPDSLKVWERGQYYDIKLRYLFKTKQYQKMVEFINKEIGYNRFINIKTDADLLNLIYVYYRDYINSAESDTEIEAFFRQHFLNKRKNSALSDSYNQM